MPTEQNELNRIREILLEPDRLTLLSLQRKIDFLEKQLGSVLSPEKLNSVMPEVIEANKPKMVEALFPIILPGIRMAVMQTFKSLVQSFQVIVEKSFSLEGLYWRVQSWYTGIPLAEVALSHSIVYRVDHLFLIHKKSGKLLKQVSLPDAIEADKVIFSGMISAILTFVQDVFQSGEPINLKSLELEHVRVFLADGKDAIIAMVVRGIPPETLHFKIQETLIEIHRKFSNELEVKNPDPNKLFLIEEVLENCLVQEMVDKTLQRKIKKFIGLGILTTFLLFIFAGSGYLWWQNRQQQKIFAQLEKSLNQIPNAILIDSKFSKGKGVFSFIAAEPDDLKLKLDKLLEESGLDTKQIEVKTYRSQVQLGSDYENLLSLFDTDRIQLESYKLQVSSTKDAELYAQQVAPLLLRLYRTSHRINKPVTVYIEHGSVDTDFARSFVFFLRKEVVDKGMLDFHFINRQSVADLKNSLRIKIKSRD